MVFAFLLSLSFFGGGGGDVWVLFFFNSQVLYVSGVLVWFLLGFLYVFLPSNLPVQSAVTGSCLSVALLVQTSHMS